MPVPSNPDWFKKYGKDWKAEPQIMPDITNKMFAGGDKTFQEACELAGVKPTSAQARKYRRKEGKAYKALKESQQAQALAN